MKGGICERRARKRRVRAARLAARGSRSSVSVPLVVGGWLPAEGVDAAFMAEFAEVARRAGDESGLALLDMTVRDDRGRVVARFK